MISMYEIYSSYDGVWGYEVARHRDLNLFWDPEGSPWAAHEVEWHLPMVEQLDLAQLSVSFAVSPLADDGVRSILARSGDMLELRGEGAGWLAFRPHEWHEWVDEDTSLRKELSPEDAQRRAARYEARGTEPSQLPIVGYRMFEDRLALNTVARVKGVRKLVAVEDESSEPDFADPARCGFRAWVKHHGVTGVVFKKIWDSTNTVHYDRNWGYETPRDAHDEWD